jgi:hypothetical protein
MKVKSSKAEMRDREGEKRPQSYGRCHTHAVALFGEVVGETRLELKATPPHTHVQVRYLPKAPRYLGR